MRTKMTSITAMERRDTWERQGSPKHTSHWLLTGLHLNFASHYTFGRLIKWKQGNYQGTERASCSRSGSRSPWSTAEPIPPSRPGSWADQGASRAAPGIKHLTGGRNGPRPGWDVAHSQAGQGRAVWSWRLALLQHRWGKDWWPRGAEMGSWAVAG